MAVVAFVVWVPTVAAAEPEEKMAPEPRAFEDKIRPLVDKYCVSCHGPKEQKGDLDLARFTTTAHVLDGFEIWKEAIGRMNVHEMPPKDSKQVGHDEMEQIDRWFNRLRKPVVGCQELANDQNQRWYRGYVMSRRLTHFEYDNTIRDLFGLDLGLARAFPADGGGGEGFDTAGNTLYTSTILLERYLAAADTIATKALDGGALEARVALSAPAAAGVDADARARAIVTDVARRAFRRPVTAAEVERLLGPYRRAERRGDSFAAALKLSIKAILISPHFLSLVEPEAPATGVYRLDGHQLATRLSYFLWSSMPDDRLFALAGSGALLDPATLRGEVRRMLRDPKARALGEGFALQWLGLGNAGATVRPDRKLFPAFDDDLSHSMRAEVVTFFNDLVERDGSALDLIDARHTFVDPRLAAHYGWRQVSGPGFRRVQLGDESRGGILGMAAVHVATSFPTRTSPVLRGKWVLEAMLGSRVPPPPETVSLDENAPGASAQTLRERLEQHRKKPECASCHDRMDPLGFGLENFDVLGRWRAADAGQALDASGKLPSGETFAGPAQLKTVLMKRKDQVVTHLTRKLLGYALGRELNKFDQCVIDQAVASAAASGYRVSPLFETIVGSYPFQNRYAKK